MPDYFALLNEPRRPWLDEGLLKGKFLELSGEAHPDRVHGAPEAEKQRANQRYAELNSAYSCLREPKSRLRHLFELETGAKPKEIEQVTTATMELCMEFGKLCREVDGFLAERGGVTSPLLKVEIFERAIEWTERLNAVQRKLNARREELTVELKQMNVAWETVAVAGPDRLSSLPLAQLERAVREFGYLSRWTGQIQERVVQLSL